MLGGVNDPDLFENWYPILYPIFNISSHKTGVLSVYQFQGDINKEEKSEKTTVIEMFIIDR